MATISSQPELNVAPVCGKVIVTLLLLGGIGTLRCQVLESVQPIIQRDIAWMHENGYPDAEYGVAVYKLRYWTPDLGGHASIASAAYVKPLEECALPLVCFIHGTEYLKNEAPSTGSDNTGAVTNGYTLGGYGFACVMPDLLGLGDSPGPHPYLNAATGARATIDAVRAAREFQIQQDDPLGGQLFLMGVSAGAHTCLATNEMMQDHYPGEFSITAAGAISGPYAVYPTTTELMTANAPIVPGADVVYLLLGYQAAYPGLFSSTSDFLVSPYDTVLPPLYDGFHTNGQIDQVIPPVLSNIIPFALKDDISHHPNAPLNQRLKQNNVYGWAPQNPVRLCYCGGDITVPPSNSIIAYDSLVANGGTSVDLFELSPTGDHGECGSLGRPFLIDWFRSLKADCPARTVVHPLMVQPNPALDGRITVSLRIDGDGQGTGSIELVDGLGRKVLDRSFSYIGGVVSETVELGRAWPAGMYFILLQVGMERYTGRLVVGHG